MVNRHEESESAALPGEHDSRGEGAIDAELADAVRQDDAEQLQNFLSEAPERAGRTDENGVSLLLLALYHRKEAALSALREVDPPLTIFDAAALGEVNVLRERLEREPGLLAAVAPDGFHPLHLASYFARAEAVSLLLEHGADVNAVADNAAKLRPIHAATAARSAVIVRRLLEAGADPDAPQSGGYTALHAAAKHGDVEIIAALRDHGARADVRSDDGRSAADFAVEGGHAELAASLQSDQPS